MARVIDYGDECPVCGKEEAECECDPALILKLKKDRKRPDRIRKRRKTEG